MVKLRLPLTTQLLAIINNIHRELTVFLDSIALADIQKGKYVFFWQSRRFYL
jgi:hypothetical protein